MTIECTMEVCNLINICTRLLMPLPGDYDIVLLCTHDTVWASTFCAHLHLYEPVHFALIITSMTQYLIRSKGLTVLALSVESLARKDYHNTKHFNWTVETS